MWFAIEIDGSADGRGIGGVVGLPEFVTENDLAVLAGVVFFGTEDASVNGVGAEDGEEVGADGAGADCFGFSGADDVEVCAPVLNMSCWPLCTGLSVPQAS